MRRRSDWSNHPVVAGSHQEIDMTLAQPGLVFAIDGGGTKTNTALFDEAGAILAEAKGGPCNLYQAPEDGLAEIRRCWAACCGSLGLKAIATARRTTLSAGLAGVTAPGAPALFAEAFRGFRSALLSGDGYTALVGAFAAAPGALVAVGTGVVGVRFNAEGRFRQVGGWGFPAGDAGGGAWIGLELVRAWLEHRDGVAPRPEAGALWHTVEAAIGHDAPSILAHLAGARPAVFAALAPLVIAATDPFAAALRARAAGHIAALAASLGEPSVVLTGGLATALAPEVAERLAASHLQLVPRPPNPLEGARLIATGVRPPQFPPAAA
jgi:glucosamine kinase